MTASGSGLDPHISVQSAEVQVPRMAEASGLGEERVRQIIRANTKGKLLGIFGSDTVHVVMVNLDIGAAMGLLPAASR
jgi:K+-transporting ATPase ATPase C chain